MTLLGGLKMMCLKCLWNEVQRQHDDRAGELVADLTRFLSDEPVQVGAVIAGERLIGWE